MHRSEVPLSFRCLAGVSTPGADRRTRWCDLCQENVHDLSERTALGARWLLATRRPRCVRYRVDGTGAVQFRPSVLGRWIAALGALVSVPAAAEPPPAAPAPQYVAPPESGSLMVTVVDDEYELPIPGVTLDLGGESPIELRTDHNGEATFTALPVGLYRLTAWRSGFEVVTMADLQVGPEGAAVVVRLRLGQIEGMLDIVHTTWSRSHEHRKRAERRAR